MVVEVRVVGLLVDDAFQNEERVCPQRDGYREVLDGMVERAVRVVRGALVRV